ncbi:hypothetical protein JCM18899A_48780 [Nocardioides sp. AN3]
MGEVGCVVGRGPPVGVGVEEVPGPGEVGRARSTIGTSVCDPNGRVWRFQDLFVAGNGALPTALACNSTLTGMTTAVRAARAISQQIPSDDDAKPSDPLDRRITGRARRQAFAMASLMASATAD